MIIATTIHILFRIVIRRNQKESEGIRRNQKESEGIRRNPTIFFINKIPYIFVLILNNQEKERIVINLLNEGKPTREIAKRAHISLRDICTVRKKISGDDGSEETPEQKYARKLKEKSYYAQCFQMFKDGKSLIDIVIELDMEADIIKNHYSDYLDLRNMKNLESIYKDIKNDFSLFIHLYRRIKKEELNKKDMTEILENQKELKDLENRVHLFNEHIDDLQSQKLQLEREIMEKERFLKIL